MIGRVCRFGQLRYKVLVCATMWEMTVYNEVRLSDILAAYFSVPLFVSSVSSAMIDVVETRPSVVM